MIDDFHFLRPWWLAALVAPLAILWLTSRSSDVEARWKGMIAPHLLASLVVGSAPPSLGIRPSHLIAAVMALAALAAAGPSWQREAPPFVEDIASLVIAVDLSPTMDAIDVTPSRLERAKLKIKDIVATRSGARTSLIAYAGSAHLVMPLTEDIALIDTYVDALATRIMPVAGKDTAKALQLAEDTLSRDGSSGTVLFLTDGVEQKAFDVFKRSTTNGIAVLGIGTAAGGLVKTADGNLATGPDGGHLLAKLDSEGLKNLHALTGTDVATMTSDDRDVRWVTQRIRTNFTQKNAENGARWLDTGWWILIPLVPLFALSFREGWVVRTGAVLIAASFAFGSGRAEAAGFIDMWLTPDQQGRLAFESGDFERAAADFNDPMWKGVSLYRAGKFADALDAFAAVDGPESWYDQGNTLLQLLKFEEAIGAYDKALALRENWPEAKANRAVAERLLKAKKDEEDEQQQDPSEPPDKIQFDDKGKQGKKGQMNIAEQTSELWMKNIQVSPADLMARKFAIEAKQAKP